MMLIIGGSGEDIDDDDDDDVDVEDNCHSKSLGWISFIRDYLQDIYNWSYQDYLEAFYIDLIFLKKSIVIVHLVQFFQWYFYKNTGKKDIYKEEKVNIYREEKSIYKLKFHRIFTIFYNFWLLE